VTSELPEVRLATEVDEWSDTVDVVVVGFGIAGACAALEAARAGASVVLLERAAAYGGTSAMAGGHFYLGGGTPVQQATGVQDSADEMYRYLTAVGLAPEPDKIRAYCDDSVAHFEWLEALGFEFERSLYPEKAVIQPGTQGLMYTGNEKVYPYRDLAVPAPRGHKVPVPGDTGGARLVLDLLAAALTKASVEVRYETGATHLVTDGERIAGVGWRRFAERGTIRAGAVVIAAGGYVANADMVAAYTPQLATKLFPLSSTYDDGLGLRLGASVGGELKFMDQAFVTAPFYPPARLLTGVIVNRLGERFVAEDSYHSRTSGFVLDQPGQAAYLIVDSEHIEHPDFPLCPFIDGWEKVDEMEAALGIPDGAPRPSIATTPTPPVARTPTSTRRPSGSSRRIAAPGAPTTSPSARRCTPASPSADSAPRSTEKYAARTARSSPACTPPVPARPTSPRTARATPPAFSSARAPTSAAAPAGTPRPFLAPDRFRPSR